MSEPFTASTQYNDYIGTVAFDGHETGGFLQEIADKANVPEGYFPIGFRVHSLWRDENKAIRMSIDVIAVPTETVGHGVDDMVEYARKNGKLPANRFESKLTFDELLPLIKRLNICACIKRLQGVDVQIEVS